MVPFIKPVKTRFSSLEYATALIAPWFEGTSTCLGMVHTETLLPKSMTSSEPFWSAQKTSLSEGSTSPDRRDDIGPLGASRSVLCSGRTPTLILLTGLALPTGINRI